MGKKVALHNLGCKVNAYEVEAMQQLLEEAGYEIVPFAPGADIYVINTCTVTNIADRKSRQMLHKAKKMNPDAIVVAAGCYVQTDKEKLETDGQIDVILGNNRKREIVEVLEEYQQEKAGQERVININQTKEYEQLSIDRTAEHVRAYIKVQDGCNQFCTYCIIPYARGRVRSRKKEDILKEIRSLAAKNYKEVVLTGIHLSSYGVDFPEGEKETLLSLIEEVHKVEGIRRIRLSSLESGIITEEFVKRISELPKVCPHFHLSLQSGSDSVLKRMNRRYTSQEYEERCGLLRKYYTNPALTPDIITGFPGETEEEFKETCRFAEKIRFYETHIFRYSKRRGTKAARMEGQIPEPVKAARSEILLKLDEQRRGEYETRRMGEPLEVLLEEEIEKEGKAYYLGHSREYIKVAVEKKKEYQINDIVVVKGTGYLENHTVLGECLDN